MSSSTLHVSSKVNCAGSGDRQPASFSGLRFELHRKRAGLLWTKRDITIEHSPESVEESVLATSREMDARIADGECKLLARVEAALERMERGEYGRCLECGEAISPKRLAAIPWTECCKVCAEAKERM